MARILLIGSHLNYNLEYFAKKAAESLGHEVRFFGFKKMLGRSATISRMAITRSSVVRSLSKYCFLNAINEVIQTEALDFSPDVMLSIKGEIVLPKTVHWMNRAVGCKSALWYPDDPRYFRSLVCHIAPHYDYIFTASERAKEMYYRIGAKNVEYLPFACDPDVHKRIELSKSEEESYSSDVCFIGTFTRRRANVIRSLSKAGISVRVWGPYWKTFFGDSRNVNDGVYGPEMVKVFNAAKVVLNIHEPSDLPYKVNTRVFEAAGSGAFLVTDKSYKLDQTFHVGSEVITYHNIDELIKKIKYYSEAEDRKLIGFKAQERAYCDHTYQQRMLELLRTMEVG